MLEENHKHYSTVSPRNMSLRSHRKFILISISSSVTIRIGSMSRKKGFWQISPQKNLALILMLKKNGDECLPGLIGESTCLNGLNGMNRGYHVDGGVAGSSRKILLSYICATSDESLKYLWIKRAKFPDKFKRTFLPYSNFKNFKYSNSELIRFLKFSNTRISNLFE